MTTKSKIVEPIANLVATDTVLMARAAAALVPDDKIRGAIYLDVFCQLSALGVSGLLKVLGVNEAESNRILTPDNTKERNDCIKFVALVCYTFYSNPRVIECFEDALLNFYQLEGRQFPLADYVNALCTKTRKEYTQ